MSKTPDTPEDAGKTEGGQPQPQQPAPQQQMQIEVSDANVVGWYANFCRVTGSPEELIIDFGLNPQPMGVPQKAVKIDQRIVLNYFTAKRLLAALSMSVQRHESAFGVLETDVQKRVRRQAAT